PFGTRLMTASGEAKVRDLGVAGARAAAFVENIRCGVGAVLRRPRRPPAPPSQAEKGKSGYPLALAGKGRAGAHFLPAWRRLRIQAALAICAAALSMLFLDTPAYEFAVGLPPSLVDWAYEITDFGRSGWILVPLGTLIVLIALLASPAL